MKLEITKIIQDGISVDKELVWLKCRTSTDKTIAFWGEFGNPNRNIAALKNQKLPVIIELLSPEDCIPTQREMIKYSLDYCVPLDAYIQINPEF